MWIVLTAAATAGLGYEISARLWSSEELNHAERGLFVAVIGGAIWLSTTWASALTGVFERPVLIGRSVVLLAAAIVFLVRRSRAEGWLASMNREVDPRRVAAILLPLVPLFCWVAYVGWRGVVLPPLSHDALSFHLPKGLLFARHGGWDDFSEYRFFMTPRPSNYELLLAEAMVTDGSDDYTEWLSVAAYIGLLLAAAALAQRWSGGNREAVLAVTILTAATPIMLLHSGAHKNDLLTAFFTTAGLAAGSRWFALRGEMRTLVVCAAAFAAAIGTKLPGFLVPLFLLPFVGAKLVRDRVRPASIGVLAAASLLFIVALGAWEPVATRLVRDPAPAASPATTSDDSIAGGYGAWRNLWRGTWVLLAAPFSADSFALDVPWSDKDWYWRRYEIYFSELGVPFTIAALLLPVLLWRRARVIPGLLPVLGATVLSVLAILPVHRNPDGFYLIGLPRFVMHLAPVVFAATIPAVIDALSRFRNSARAAVAVAVLVFVFYAATNAVYDLFAPLEFAIWARRNPGTRVVLFNPFRAECVVDRMAGPHDPIAIDAGSTAWIYPAYGARLTRPVYLIPPGDGSPRIPANTKWIVIDRTWMQNWGDPNFKDLGDWKQKLGRGEPMPEDTRVLRHLAQRRDEFKLVYFDKRRLQAVFQRVR